jgi:poly-gamma-glutamate synthesis protein (capsule biosynthesis protein)
LTPQPKLIAAFEHFDAFKGHQGKQYKIFCTANNHMLDDGLRGFNTTHDQLESEGFYYVGSNRSPEDQKKGLIISSNNIKFGLVAATYRMNNRGLGHYPEDMEKCLVNVIPFHSFQGKVDLSLLEDQISYCKAQNCDFIIVSLHWGMEFEFFPRQDQVNIAHHLIEFGADAIISHHAHNIQPYELYQTRRDPQRIAPIFYGLGNLSSLWSAPYFALSMIVNFNVIKGTVDNAAKTLAAQVKVDPVLQLEYEYKKKPFLQIENLRDLINSSFSDSRRDYFIKAGKYADLALGKNWRI